MTATARGAVQARRRTSDCGAWTSLSRFGTIVIVGVGLGLLAQTAEESDNWDDTVFVVLYGPWLVMACALLLGLGAATWALSSGVRRRAAATDEVGAAEGSWLPRTHAPQGDPWRPDDARWDAYQREESGGQ